MRNSTVADVIIVSIIRAERGKSAEESFAADVNREGIVTTSKQNVIVAKARRVL